MAAAGRSGIRVELSGSGAASVETGLPVLDRLLERLAEYARFDLALEVEPGAAEVEVAEAGSALGRALAELLRADGARGYGYASMTSSEALASVVLEVVGRAARRLERRSHGGADRRPRDGCRSPLPRASRRGCGADVARPPPNGTDTQHVLEAIFKALGVALAQATSEGGSGGR